MLKEERNLHHLIAKCAKGDVHAQKQIYYQFFSLLMSTCLRYVKSKEDAEHIVHDSFLKIFSSIDTYNSRSSFSTWIVRICINTCIDYLRRSSAVKNTVQLNTLYDERLLDRDDEFVENTVFEKLSLSYVLSILDQLPEREKLVFKLSVFDDYGHKEIGTLLGITDNHSQWLLHQARKKLKTLITNAMQN